MKSRVFALLLLAAAGRVHASCGSSSCPLDLRGLDQPAKGGFTLDLSYQYVDQDQPRIGTRDAHVGDIHGAHHDEVRTRNQIATALLTYAPTDRVSMSVAVPYVSRDHDHLGSSHAHGKELAPQHNVIPESWQLRGVGDVLLEARVAVAGFNAIKHSGLWLIAGVKLPTGKHDLANHEGEAGELPIQPGTGTTDVLAGFSYQNRIVGRSPMRGEAGNFAVIPWFLTATYQFRTGDADGYRLGNELQLNVGTAYPLRGHLEALLQLNGRYRAHDHIENPAERADAAFTGGKFLYLSPGIRIAAGRGTAVYGLVQLPLYQDVNALQLTSHANFVAGVQTRFE